MMCHKFTAALMAGRAVVSVGVQPYSDVEIAAMSVPCIGSACAMWVPEVGAADDPRPATVGWTSADRYAESTGRGWCAENLRREPWADPAGGGK